MTLHADSFEKLQAGLRLFLIWFAVLPVVHAETLDDMQLVKGATFETGSDPAELEVIRKRTGLGSTTPLLPEVPAHTVTVAAFYMDTYDVTNADFQAFVRAVPDWRKDRIEDVKHNGRYLEHWNDGGPPDDQLRHPVTFVTWHAACAYCEWRNKRLPTEAEFEWAAQDGESYHAYPWGDDPPRDDLVSWGGNGIQHTVPVGSYPANSRGLYDMSGNVWYFTADPWLGSHADGMSQDADAAAQDSDVRRVVKGGSWGANAANLRVRYRDSHRPYDAREMVGFRCARSSLTSLQD